MLTKPLATISPKSEKSTHLTKISSYFILFFFLFVWVPLGAQTFEKTITISPFFNHFNKVITTPLNEILISGSSFQITSDSTAIIQYTSLIHLSKSGELNRLKILKTYEFNNTSPIDTAFEFNDFIATYESPNKIKLLGSFRVNEKNSSVSALLELDSSFIVQNVHVIDTIEQHLVFNHKAKRFSNSFYIQAIKSLITPYDYYRLIEIDSLNRIKEFNLYDTITGLRIYQLHDFLQSKSGINYYFGNVLDTNNQYHFNQIIKLNSKQVVLKRKLIDYPLTSRDVTEFIFPSIDASWTLDSNIAMVITVDTEFDHKGDIHLFLFDTSLTQLKYKRLITHDSLEQAFYYQNLVFDSVSNCFYFACHQKASDDFSNIIYSQDTSDFRLVKFDKDLNIRFDRRYRRNKTMMMNTLTTDSEGNVIMVGQIQDPDRTNLYHGDLYILKVDSLGNFNPIGISEEKIDPLNYALFPNPADDQLVFRQYNLNEKYNLKIYDNKGVLIKKERISQQEQIINVTSLTTGVYIYLLEDSKNRMISGKIMKK
ncbi:MAG: T9SS C-terminal target domain-containing protein [Bacteroidetes bacterium]|nr:MAG: T9SS C-terminal target domain-containing protein [Bacteroidota bacterium]MBL1145541.1 T9SS C-terminal target domain-containing protein [Bacteroidota bacterium]NOG58338.1 T9SS type A sorting domain-containing protein [Bacteroidota bacterium]